jgi:hypothetical protein
VLPDCRGLDPARAFFWGARFCFRKSESLSKLLRVDVDICGRAATGADDIRASFDLQAAGFTSFARKTPKLIANQPQNEPDPGMPDGAIADK